jgi:ABC-type uncharacterized transport system permease subunit
MYTLFIRVILTNWRSILTLFIVLIFSGTSFLTLREITTNVDAFVTTKTKPLFGADIVLVLVVMRNATPARDRVVCHFFTPLSSRAS